MVLIQAADGENGLQSWKLGANILNKQSRTTDKGWSFRGYSQVLILRTNLEIQECDRKNGTTENGREIRSFKIKFKKYSIE
jgi:hypothetical protein